MSMNNVIPPPNYTQIPNVVIDYWMHKLSNSDFKVLICMCRKTLGWQKHFDKISNKQIKELTGLGRSTIIDSLNSLVDLGLIYKVENYTTCGDQDSNTYYLNITEIEDGVVQNLDPTPSNIWTTGSPKSGPTKETNTKEKVCTVRAGEPAGKNLIVFPKKGKAVESIESDLLFEHLDHRQLYSHNEIQDAIKIVENMKQRPKLSCSIQKYVEGIILKTRKQEEIQNAIAKKSGKKKSSFDLSDTPQVVTKRENFATPEEIEQIWKKGKS